MLVIRLFRTGKKNQPFFKIVVTDKTNPTRSGRFVEEVGNYNPLTKEKILKAERIKYWLSVGAKPSPTVYNLLVSEKIIEGKKIKKNKKSKKAETVTPAPESSTVSQEKPVKETPKEPAVPTQEVKEAPKTEAVPDEEVSKEAE